MWMLYIVPLVPQHCPLGFFLWGLSARLSVATHSFVYRVDIQIPFLNFLFFLLTVWTAGDKGEETLVFIVKKKDKNPKLILCTIICDLQVLTKIHAKYYVLSMNIY